MNYETAFQNVIKNYEQFSENTQYLKTYRAYFRFSIFYTTEESTHTV